MCRNAANEIVTKGYESANNTNATAAKWSAPPPGFEGQLAERTAVALCGTYFDCFCDRDLLGVFFCDKDFCGISFLYTLEPHPTITCFAFEQ
jgi:hypothetical protein